MASPADIPTPTRIKPVWLIAAAALVILALVVGVAFGAVGITAQSIVGEILNRIPGITIDTGLTEQQSAIVWKLRIPRVILALLVGGMLALAGGCYQGVFRNPLADPMLLGVASGAGLGATMFIIARNDGANLNINLLPVAAFVGSMLALTATYLLGGAKRRGRNPGTLILAGVAVSSFGSAIQTYMLQRNVDDLASVYSWLLGRLSTADWNDVKLLLPYAGIMIVAVLARQRELDVLSVGDTEAITLGLHPERSRIILLTAASLGTAAAVSVSGLIGFVGIVVPHIVRLLAGRSYRVILPLSLLIGGAFLVVADLFARTIVAPAELPIGVVTAFIGAPFFILVMRTAKEVNT